MWLAVRPDIRRRDGRATAAACGVRRDSVFVLGVVPGWYSGDKGKRQVDRRLSGQVIAFLRSMALVIGHGDGERAVDHGV